MTLDEAAKLYRWSSVHDYGSEDLDDQGKIVAIYSLGIWETDLGQIKALVPGLKVYTKRRVEHDHGDWLRVDLREARTDQAPKERTHT